MHFFINTKLTTMGIDLIRGGRIPNRGRRETKTSNSYLKTLIKVLNIVNSALFFPHKKNLI